MPYKIVRRTLWEQARPLIPEQTLAPSLFLAVFAQRRGARIAVRGVAHLPRTTGEVSIRRWKLFRFLAVAFVQLLVFRWKLR